MIADAILDARDNVLRDVNDLNLDLIEDYADATARTLSVQIPVSGWPTVDDQGSRYCRVDILGRDHPHLLPEYQVWRFMFNAWAKAVDYNVREHGLITEEYLRLLTRSQFKGMATEDVGAFLRIAAETNAAVERLTGAAPPTGQSFETLLQRTVLNGRRSVLRTISIESWRALIAYVDQFRVGVKVWFTGPL